MSYDVIVLGTGGIGSATAYDFARRGLRVLGLDRFNRRTIGAVRTARLASFGRRTSSIPTTSRSCGAYSLWDELEKTCGEQLFFPVGLLEIGPADGVVVPGVLESARRYNLEVDQLSAVETAERFPGFTIPDGHRAVFERRAGYLAVEKCIAAYLDEARKLGADLRSNETVVEWRAEGNGVVVQTETETFTAAHLIVTAGAWAGSLVAELGIPLRVLRKHLHWFANSQRCYHQEGGGPTFFYETPAGYYYGFPQIDDMGVKVAEHSGGSEVADPLTDARESEDDERLRVGNFITGHLPGVEAVEKKHAVCFYTMSPDEHFIVDRHPQHSQVAFAAGLSGHGFKFAGVLGEVLADLVLQGTTEQPVDFLRCSRFA